MQETRARTLSTSNENYNTELRSINSQIVPSNEVVHVENNDSSVLQEVTLPHEYLPKPGTKVTTTVRTYTYEIPDKDNLLAYPEKNTAVFYKTERRERSGGVYPNTSTPIHHPSQNFPPLAIQETPPQTAVSSSVYKYESSNKSSTISGQHQVPPGGITVYPPQPTTIYKTETVNTTNKQYRSPTPNNYPSSPDTYPTTYHRHNEPPTVVNYRQTTTTRNVIHPHEKEPLLHPFPVNGPVITEVDGNPPKRVEDLMATFGDVSLL
jgi:hypothetical protein